MSHKDLFHESSSSYSERLSLRPYFKDHPHNDPPEIKYSRGEISRDDMIHELRSELKKEAEKEYTPMTRCTKLAIVAYVLIGFLTFAWVYDDDDYWSRSYPSDRAATSFFGGILWPVYWAGVGSFYVVHQLKHLKVEVRKS